MIMSHVLTCPVQLLGCVSLCRVHRRHRAIPHGVRQGSHPDERCRYLPDHPEVCRTQDLGRRGHQRVLQVPGTSVGQADPLHHDEVRLLRANGRDPLQARRAQAQVRVLKERAVGRHIGCRLHRRRSVQVRCSVFLRGSFFN